MKSVILCSEHAMFEPFKIPLTIYKTESKLLHFKANNSLIVLTENKRILIYASLTNLINV